VPPVFLAKGGDTVTFSRKTLWIGGALLALAVVVVLVVVYSGGGSGGGGVGY
jgi:hypothetical protein